MATAHIWPIKHMNINDVYVHDPSRFPRIFFKDMPNSAGKFPHGDRTVLPQKYLLADHLFGFYYIQGMSTVLSNQLYTPYYIYL